MREAAAKAGYGLFPERTGCKLLRRSDIQKEIETLSKKNAQGSMQEIYAGYRRLAFGSVADAVRLLYLPDDFDLNELDSMDLFNISDIKRPKGGGMEIKFFDRQKALERLEEISAEDVSDSALPFYEALEKSARSLASVPSGDDED